MCSIVNWHFKLAKAKVVDLIQKHFNASQVLFVLKELADHAGLDEPGRHVNNQNRTALSLYADEIVDMVSEVSNMLPHKLPDYLVPAHSLHLLPVVSLTESEVSLSVRMEKLEKAVQALADRPAQQPQRGGPWGLPWRGAGHCPTGGLLPAGQQPRTGAQPQLGLLLLSLKQSATLLSVRTGRGRGGMTRRAPGGRPCPGRTRRAS